MVIEISVAVIAAAFVVLVLYLISLIMSLRKTLSQANQTLVEARKQLSDIGGQAQKTMEHANQISFDLKQKSEALNPLFNAVANAGDILDRKSYHLKKDFLAQFDEESEPSLFNSAEKKRAFPAGATAAAAVLELVGIGIRLWQKQKKRS